MAGYLPEYEVDGGEDTQSRLNIVKLEALAHAK
jgi:hypothetical protein